MFLRFHDLGNESDAGAGEKANRAKQIPAGGNPDSALVSGMGGNRKNTDSQSPG